MNDKNTLITKGLSYVTSFWSLYKYNNICVGFAVCVILEPCVCFPLGQVDHLFPLQAFCCACIHRYKYIHIYRERHIFVTRKGKSNARSWNVDGTLLKNGFFLFRNKIFLKLFNTTNTKISIQNNIWVSTRLDFKLIRSHKSFELMELGHQLSVALIRCKFEEKLYWFRSKIWNFTLKCNIFSFFQF